MIRSTLIASLLSLLLSTSVAFAKHENHFDKAQWHQALEHFNLVGTALENQLFDDYSIAKQALTLGSYLWFEEQKGANNNAKESNQKQTNAITALPLTINFAKHNQQVML